MNFFKKLKLRTMLRNCDYILAGTVIKQQYYDENKNTQINRMIDQFMANPGFDEAVKLIKHNEMMVYYFTESCHGGLYVRKQESSHQHTPVEPLDPDSNFIDLAKYIEDQGEHHFQPKEEPQLETEADPTHITSSHQDDEIAVTEEDLSPPDVVEHEQIHIAATPDTPVETEEPLLQVKPELPEEPLVEPLIEPQSEPKVFFEDPPEESVPSQDQVLPDNATSDAVPLEPRKYKHTRHSFPNVIKTLSIDLNTMVKQVEEYELQIKYGSPNEEQLRSWIVALEKGIHEFALAIDVLEGKE